MRFTDCLATVFSVSEPPMKQEKYSRGKQEQNSHEKDLDVSILKPMMKVLEGGGEHNDLTHTKSKQFIRFICFGSVA